MGKVSFFISTSVLCLFAASLVAAPAEVTSSHTLDVRQFGAAMDGRTDDTEAFERAVSAAADGALIEIPAGTAILSRPIRVAGKTLTFRGAGAFSARLRWIGKGGFECSDSRTWNDTKGMLASWEITGLCFQAGVPGAGTALHLAPQSARLSPSVIVRDCLFEPAPGASTAYWTTSIHTHGGHLGQITGCYFRGAPNPSATTTHHIWLSGNSTTFMIENCHGQQSIYGILVEGQTEGALISKCFFVQNAYGYALNIEKGGEPMFDVSQSHAASSVHSLWIKNGRSSSITGNLFVLRGDPYRALRAASEAPSMVRIEGGAAKDIAVIGNALQMNDKDMKDAFVGIDIVSGRNILILGNTIAHNFSSGGETAIRFGDEAGSSLVTDNIITLKDFKAGADVSVSPRASDVIVHRYTEKP